MKVLYEICYLLMVFFSLINLLFTDKISFLKQHFPYSLTSSVLLANLLWEYLMHWDKDIKRLEALEAALFTLRQIPSKRIRNGNLYSIM